MVMVSPTENEMKEYARNEEEEEQMGQETAGRFSKDKIRHDLVAPWALNDAGIKPSSR